MAAISWKPSGETGATWKPRCPSAITKPSDDSLLRISRKVLTLAL